MMAAKVFISYRWADSAGYAGRADVFFLGSRGNWLQSAVSAVFRFLGDTDSRRMILDPLLGAHVLCFELSDECNETR
jgi:hypothetical protein